MSKKNLLRTEIRVIILVYTQYISFLRYNIIQEQFVYIKLVKKDKCHNYFN